MSEISELILLLNKQHQEQMAVLRDEHPTPMTSFQPFDSTSELWTDYLARFRTFVTANSIPDNKQAQIFLTNQSNSVYKMLSNLAAQQQPVKSIHELTMNDIQTFMAEQFDPKRFVVRERFKFWSDMKRKPGETIPELASRIRQDAATCDFQSIKDPLDEALRTKFICSVDNEAVLKTLFKLKDDELKFSNAIRVAQEVEEAAKVAKETVHGQPSTSVQKVYHAKSKTSKTQEKKTACFRCGNSGHFRCTKSNVLFHPSIKLLDLMTTELSLKLIAEPVTHFAVKRRGKRWVNPFYNLYLFNIKLLKVARYPSWDNSNQLQVLMENHLT